MVIWNGVLDVFVTVIIIWVKSSRIVRLMAIQKLTQFFTDLYITVLAIKKIATMAIWVNWVIIIWSGGTRPCVRGCAALLLVTPVVSNEQLIMLQSWMFKCLWRGKNKVDIIIMAKIPNVQDSILRMPYQRIHASINAMENNTSKIFGLLLEVQEAVQPFSGQFILWQ